MLAAAAFRPASWSEHEVQACMPSPNSIPVPGSEAGPDGSLLSARTTTYNPTPQQAEVDRQKAYEAGVPHGFVAPGDRYSGLPTVPLLVVSELHKDSEYGDQIDSDGGHCGGEFWISVSPSIRVEDLRRVIREKGGIPPGLQRLSYAGKNLEESHRTLEQYGITCWQAKFPQWPLKIRRCAPPPLGASPSSSCALCSIKALPHSRHVT